MQRLKGNEKLTRAQKAELIETWVNNPNINIADLGKKYGLLWVHTSALISKVWFYKKPSDHTITIVKSSAMNDDAELKKTA